MRHLDSPDKALARRKFHTLRSYLSDRCYLESDSAPHISSEHLNDIIHRLQIPVKHTFLSDVEQYCSAKESLIDFSKLLDRLSFKHKRGKLTAFVYVPSSDELVNNSSSSSSSEDTSSNSLPPQQRPQSAPAVAMTTTITHPFAVDCTSETNECLTRLSVWKKISAFKHRLAHFDFCCNGEIDFSMFCEILRSFRVSYSKHFLAQILSKFQIEEGSDLISYQKVFDFLKLDYDSLNNSKDFMTDYKPWIIPHGTAEDQYKHGFVNENFNNDGTHVFRSMVKRPKTACTIDPGPRDRLKFAEEPAVSRNDKVEIAKSRNPLLSARFTDLGKCQSYLSSCDSTRTMGEPYPIKKESIIDVIANQFCNRQSNFVRNPKVFKRKNFGYSKSTKTCNLRTEFIKNRLKNMTV
ncbi:hypothetical protein GEMRC1_007575 [Eukaryota sp. GEM-RC1]